jgi:multidrug efflux pump subunit AcrA (membrane-fusion protein)
MVSSRKLFTLLLVLAVAGLGYASYLAVGAPSTPKAVSTTATVSKGSVLSSVTATGNASAATQLSLNFQASGTITEVDVAVGQHVNAGQVLAKVDNATQQVSLQSAQASLAAAQAKLMTDEQVETPQQRAVDQLSGQSAQLSVATATMNVTNSQASAAQDATTNQQALAAARASATMDATTQQSAVADAQANAAQDAAAQQAAVTQAQQKEQQDAQSNQSQQIADQDQLNIDQTKLNTDVQSNAPTPTQQADQAKVAQDQAKISQDQAATQQDQTAVTNAQNSQQATALKDAQAVSNAQNSQQATALKDAQAVSNAQNSQQAGALKDAQAVQSAQQQIASAQLAQQSTAAGNAVKQTPPTSGTVAADRASIDNAQGQLDTAQTNLSGTILTAPVAGTVSAVNGEVGETSSGSSGSSSSSSASSSTASAGSAGSGFVTLTDLTTLQVIAGFSETDAAKIALGQPATVTFNALPNQQLQGKVATIDINSVVVSNVVTYNVTVSILNPPATVKPGMTANVAVTTAKRDAVLTLPSSAISGTGSSATVQLQQPGGKTVARTVTIGLRGDTAVEIMSGLNAGDTIVISRGGAAAGTATNTPRIPVVVGGGLGGGGGGGLGGGARGG